MGQILHGSATTTEAVRRAIQRSEESVRGLARRHGISPTTVQKWRKRASVSDAKATIQGVELETSVAPLRGLRLDGNLGLTDAKYDAFNNLTGLAPGQSATSLKFDRVPKWTAYLGGTYETRVGEATDQRLSFNVGWTWRSNVFTDVLNKPVLEQKAYGLLNASASYRRGPFTLGVFGRNITNVAYAEIKSRNTGFNAFGGAPRFYGLEAGYRF